MVGLFARFDNMYGSFNMMNRAEMAHRNLCGKNVLSHNEKGTLFQC